MANHKRYPEENQYNHPCQYCGGEVHLVDASVVYGGHSKKYGRLYVCSNYPKCDAYVGAHKRSHKPLGTVANRELRRWRQVAHKAFDPLWLEGSVSRSDAYSWLAAKMGQDEVHIGESGLDDCKAIIDVCFTHSQLGAHYNTKPKFR